MHLYLIGKNSESCRKDDQKQEEWLFKWMLFDKYVNAMIAYGCYENAYEHCYFVGRYGSAKM